LLDARHIHLRIACVRAHRAQRIVRVTRRFALLAFVLLGVLTAGCDHAAKHAARVALGDGRTHEFAGELVRFQLVHNTGGFLSLGARLPDAFRDAFFLFAAPLGVGLLAASAFRSAARSRAALAGLGLLCGGGLANWLDRLLNAGAVTDFVSLGVGALRTGIFNVADVAIMAGAALLLLPIAAEKSSDEAARES
jgi:signal peptidase II